MKKKNIDQMTIEYLNYYNTNLWMEVLYIILLHQFLIELHR